MEPLRISECEKFNGYEKVLKQSLNKMMIEYDVASKLYGVNATIMIFVFVLYCIE